MTALAHSPRTRGALAGLAIVFWATLLTRLPFTVGTGVGADADAWRLLVAGQMTADNETFQSSRPPTYPLVELAAAALAGAPWSVFPTLTAVLGAIGAAAFADLLRTLRVRNWWLPTAGFVLTPVIWRNDVTFLDFSWSLAFLLLAFALLARHRHLASGVALGLALAARPSTVVLVVVVIAVLMLSGAPLGRWLRVGTPATVITALAYAVPTVAFRGLRFVDAYTADVPWSVAAAHASTGVWGPLGAFAVVVLALVAVHRIVRGRSTVTEEQRRWVIAGAAGIVLVGAGFLALPLEPAYLSPVVPLAWMLFAVVVPARATAVAVVAVASSSLVTFGPDPAFGTTLPQDRAVRIADLDYARHVTGELDRIPGTVVIARTRMPVLLAMQPRELLTGPEFTAADRRVGTPPAVALPGGVVLVYGSSDIPHTAEAAPRVKLMSVPYSDAPELRLHGG